LKDFLPERPNLWPEVTHFGQFTGRLEILSTCFSFVGNLLLLSQNCNFVKIYRPLNLCSLWQCWLGISIFGQIATLYICRVCCALNMLHM